jgi:hypothetical protein
MKEIQSAVWVVALSIVVAMLATFAIGELRDSIRPKLHAKPPAKLALHEGW